MHTLSTFVRPDTVSAGQTFDIDCYVRQKKHIPELFHGFKLEWTAGQAIASSVALSMLRLRGG